MDEKPVRLNLGGGETTIDGFINIDRKCGVEAYPLPYGENSVDEIRASHVLEHFGHRRVVKVLQNWVACLKPGGLLRIAVPDFRWINDKYAKGEPIDVQGYTMGSQADDNDCHYAIFDREALTEMMINAKLERIRRWTSEIEDCARLPVSLNLQGYKPLSDTEFVDKTVAVLSCPRFGPTLHARSAFNSLSRAHVPYSIMIGAYWWQVLSELIEKAIAKDDLEFIFTVDYDSIFGHEDVMELYRLIRAHDDADAVVPLQMKRGGESPLIGMDDSGGKARQKVYRAEFQRNLVPINRGHFGLTIFRASTLREHARPWMTPVVGDNGRWDDSKVDADINFWHRWQEAGYSVFLAPKVVVGHLEEIVSWPTSELTAHYQTTKDFIENGVPAEVAR